MFFDRNQFLGTKIKRLKKEHQVPDSNVTPKYSEVKAKDGQKFLLLPGKDRGNEKGTELGSGYEGRVKKALDQKEVKVAVKISNYENSNFEVSLFREYQFLILMGDRNPTFVITEHITKGKNRFHAYLFQEFIEGKPLCAGDYCTSGFLVDVINNYLSPANQEKQTIILNLTNAMLKIFDLIDNMHAKGILHQDLTYSNVMWDEKKDTGKIIDFGWNTKLTKEVDQSKIEDLKLKDFMMFCEHIVIAAEAILENNKKPYTDLDDKDVLKQFIKLMGDLKNLFKESQGKKLNALDVVAEARQKIKNFIGQLGRKPNLAANVAS